MPRPANCFRSPSSGNASSEDDEAPRRPAQVQIVAPGAPRPVPDPFEPRRRKGGSQTRPLLFRSLFEKVGKHRRSKASPGGPPEQASGPAHLEQQTQRRLVSGTMEMHPGTPVRAEDMSGIDDKIHEAQRKFYLYPPAEPTRSSSAASLLNSAFSSRQGSLAPGRPLFSRSVSNASSQAGQDFLGTTRCL